MRPTVVRAWSAVHTWTSLVCTLFLLMLCLTGLPLIFHHEIDDFLGHDRWRPANPGGPLLSYDAVLDRALAARPGEVPIYLSFDDDRPVVNVTTGPRADAPGGQMHFVAYDLTSGEPVPPVKGGGVMDIILQLHTDMFAGLPGMLFLGAMGGVFAASVMSGVVLYAPFMRKLAFGTVRARRSGPVKWLDLHNLLGVVTAAWVLVVGLTGVVNTLATPIIALWKADALASLKSDHASAPPAGGGASIAAAVETAQRALPGMTRQFVAYPGSVYSSDRHYAVFLHGGTPLTRRLVTPALVDAGSGRLTAVVGMPWYVKALSLSQPLHFGDYAGLPLKIIWALLDGVTLVVLGSGLYLWIARRRSGPTTASAASLAVET